MYIDLLTQIKNAQMAGKSFVKIPYSKMDLKISELLVDGGFLGKVKVQGRSPKKALKIYLNKEKQIKGVNFLSRPSLLKYSGYNEMRPVKNGYGILVVSTSKGVMDGVSARKEKMGGQLLFEIW